MDENESKRWPKLSYLETTYQHFLSGLLAGTLTSIICAPLDLIRVRVQVEGTLGLKKFSSNAFCTVKMIIKEEKFTGLFKGLGASLFTLPIFLAIYWPVYHSMKIVLAENYPHIPSYMNHSMSAIIGEGLSSILTNPLWVVRTRIQTDIFHNRYSGKITFVNLMSKIYREEGIVAFTRGISASLLGLISPAVQFPLYEKLKIYFNQKTDNQFFAVFSASFCSSTIATAISYPHEVIRSRMQDSQVMRGNLSHPSIISVIRELISKEGVLSLWTGFGLSLFRILPATCTSFVVYEYLVRIG